MNWLRPRIPPGHMSPAVTLHPEQWQQRANTAQTHRPGLVRAPATVYRLSSFNVTFPITTVLLPPPVHVCQLSAPNQCLVSVVSSVTFRPPAQRCLHRNLGSGHTAMVPTFSLSCSSRGQEHGNNCGIQYLCFNKKQINSEIHSKYLPTKYEGETIPLICLV